MKNLKHSLFVFAALVAFAALAASCLQPLDPPDSGIAEGAGQVVLTVSTGEAGSARTILPTESPAFTRYKVEFTGPGTPVTINNASDLTGAGLTQELDALGSWTASVEAYRRFTPTGGTEQEYLAAQGSESVTVAAGQVTPVTVPVRPVPVGTGVVKGIFTYRISFPAGVTGTLEFDGVSYTLSTSGQTVSLEVDPGYYDLFISLTNAEGKPAGAAEKVHIYSGLKSEAVYSFTAADFEGTLPYNTWMGGEISVGGEVDWYSFTPASAGTYALQWDDRYNSLGDKTANLYVSAYRGSPGGTPVFTGQPSGYTNPRSITVSLGETIYVRVEHQSPDYGTGTYALQYYDPAASPPQAAPPYLYVRGNPKPANVITWNRLSGATGYTVYRSATAEGSYTLIGTMPGSESTYEYAYTDTGVFAETTYYYKVSASNGNGEGIKSPLVSSTVPAIGTGIALSHNSWADGEISPAGEVDWYKFTPSSAGAYTLQWDDGYNSLGGKTANLYVSAYRSGDGTPVFSGQPSGYTNPRSVTASLGETIYVRVEHQSPGYGTGTYALQYYDPAASPPQAAPPYLYVRGNPKPANVITWNRLAGTTEYTVYRSITAEGAYTHLGTVPGSDSIYEYAYTDTGVSAGTTYYYKVSASNGNGEGVQSPPLSGAAPSVGTTVTALTHNSWADGEINPAGEVDWYSITPSSAGAYTLQWDDGYNSLGDKTASLYVSAYRSGDGTPVFSGQPSGYTNPRSITVSLGETIYVRVEHQSPGYGTGTYALRYYQGITGGDEFPFILSPDSNTLTVNIMGRGNGVTSYLPADPECDTWTLQNDVNKGTFPIGKWVKGEEYILFTATAITRHAWTDTTGIYSINSDTGILSVLWSY
jgi:sarcosine oxidase delta subunit